MYIAGLEMYQFENNCARNFAKRRLKYANWNKIIEYKAFRIYEVNGEKKSKMLLKTVFIKINTKRHISSTFIKREKSVIKPHPKKDNYNFNKLHVPL